MMIMESGHWIQFFLPCFRTPSILEPLGVVNHRTFDSDVLDGFHLHIRYKDTTVVDNLKRR